MAASWGLRRCVAFGLGLGALVRLPFWIEAWRTPLSTDLSIIGLMAMHPGLDLTMWSQPYGAPTEAWLAVPFFAVLGPTADALRLLYAILALALIPVGTVLAHTLHPRATLPVAIVLACPPPYLLVLGALPPPLYPLSLLLCLSILLIALRIPTSRSLGAYGGVLLWGLLSGLALWTHPFCLSAVLPSAVLLAWRQRAHWSMLVLGLAALLLGSAPLIATAVARLGLGSVLRAQGSGISAQHHLAYLLPHLHRPLAGLIGASWPILADSRVGTIRPPSFLSAIVVMLYVGSLALALWRRRSVPQGALLWGTLGLALLCFLLPVRSNPNTIRYLTPLYVPLALLVVLAHCVGPRPRRATQVALLLAGLHLVGDVAVLRAWHGWDRAAAPFVLPDLTAVERALGHAGIRRGFSSRDVAFRITFATRERIVLAQPWNQRFRGCDVPYLDEVRFARRLAWVIPHRDTNPFPLPSPGDFGQRLRSAEGRWTTFDADSASVFYDFEPPLVGPIEIVDTAAAAPGSSSLELDLARAGALDGITLLAPADGGYLPDDLLMRATIEDSDGSFREIERHVGRDALQWLDGHPEYALYGDARVFLLPGRAVRELMIASPSGVPWTPGVVLAHPTSDHRARPTPEWLDPDATWEARRRELQTRPLPDLAAWHFRLMLAERRQHHLTARDVPPVEARRPQAP